MTRGFLCLILGALSATAQPAPDPAGIWEGALDGGGMRLRIAFHITRSDSGKLQAKIDSLDQGVRGIPVAAVSWEAPVLRLALPPLAASYEGKLHEDGKILDGTWTQRGQQLPLLLTRVTETSKLNRPQTPQPPFPYRELPVTVVNAEDKAELAGTLTVPSAARGQKFPALLLITGSGPQDRDETILEHKPFFVVADYLTRRGFAVLRLDDRGVGASKGDFRSATTRDFARDANSALTFLRSRPEVDAQKAGLLGHSEGALIASMVAAGRPNDVAFLVLLAAPGLPTPQGLLEQGEALLKASGAPPEAIRQQRLVQETLFPLLLSSKGSIELKPLIAEKLGLDGAPESARAIADAQIAQSLSPWFRQLLAMNPADFLQKVKCPVLTLYGEKDTQVVAASNLKAVSAALAKGGNQQHEETLLPGLNHLFQRAQRGTPAEYGQIEETISPEVLDRVGKWLERVIGR